MGNPRKIWIVAKTILALEEEAEEKKKMVVGGVE